MAVSTAGAAPALIRAADRGHATIVEVLLDTKIDIDHVNRIGYTALHEAVVLGDGGPSHQRTVAALVRGGVDTSIKDPQGGPHSVGRERGYDRIAALLGLISGPQPRSRVSSSRSSPALSSAGSRSRSVVKARNIKATVTSCSGRCTTSTGSPAWIRPG